jgi:hypothetical protein
VNILEAGSGVLTASPTSTSATTQATQSANGSRLILTSYELTASQVSTVYDAALNALGDLPNDLRGVVVSPDGSYAYAYSTSPDRLRKFELTTPGFPEVAAVVIPDSPGAGFARIAITPDGSRLFILGNQKFIVAPTP